jgi:carboxypeptidase family protein
MKAAAVLLILSALTAPAAEAQPAREARRGATGTGVVSGFIVSDEPEPHPVRHARVVCSAGELTHALTAVSDDSGRFSCAGLPAGRYTIKVTRDGWVTTAYGATNLLQLGTAVPLGDGERAEVVVRMLRGAVITGTLLDESGQAATGATVVALRVSQQNGARRLTAAGVPAVADDRGVYRIYGLAPGDYVVAAGPSGTALSVLDAQLTTDVDVRHAQTAAPSAPPPERHVTFASTYYPGTAIALQAAPLQLGGGEERSEIDFALQLVPTARIEGTLTLPDGGPAPVAAQISLVASGASAFPGTSFDGLKTTRPAGDGSFAFAGIAPGTYTVLARLASPSVLWAATQIAVDGETISGLTIALQPSLSIAGELRVDGSGARVPFNFSAVKIRAEPILAAGDVSLAPSAVTADAKGQFMLAGVPPGRYRLVATLPGDAQSAVWVQALDVPVSVGVRPITGAIITLTDRPRSR